MGSRQAGLERRASARLTVRRERELVLRRASLVDADDLLAWRNDPDTRQASFSEAAIGRPEHLRWLERKLADPDCRLWIGSVAGEPIGQVRVEGIGGGRAVVHLVVAPAHRGYGHGVQLLHAAARQIREEGLATELIARIKPDNAASLAVFERAEFTHGAPERGVIVVVRPCPR
jgi:RimJ/RimL family protein N-acetyltransferase